MFAKKYEIMMMIMVTSKMTRPDLPQTNVEMRNIPKILIEFYNIDRKIFKNRMRMNNLQRNKKKLPNSLNKCYIPFFNNHNFTRISYRLHSNTKGYY